MDKWNNQQEYYAALQAQLAQIKASTAPIVLFGAKQLGRIARLALQHLGKTPFCYLDNGASDADQILDGIPLLPPSGLQGIPQDAVFYLCVFSKENLCHMKEQLAALNFFNILLCDVLFWVYNTQVKHRGVDPERFAYAMYQIYHREDSLKIHNVSVIITERCTLRCKECGVFIPYYQNPRHHDAGKIAESVTNMMQSVDGAHIVTLMGGEPLLHPQLVGICREITAIDNIAILSLTTNGTVIPPDSVLRELADVLTYVTISDYGEGLSTQKQALIQKLDEFGIVTLILDDSSVWYKQNNPLPHYRAETENASNFKSCFWVQVASKLINGQYHLCDFSAGIAPFHRIPDNAGDYVDFLDKSKTAAQLREEWRQLNYHKPCLAACDYCEIYALPPTKRAEQAKGVLSFE